METTTFEIGRALLILIGAACVFLATRQSGPARRGHRAPAAVRIAVPRQPDQPDDNGAAHLRLSAIGRNRWDRRDLAHGIGTDHSLGGSDLAVWPSLPVDIGGR
jgi:hypothetical protein